MYEMCIRDSIEDINPCGGEQYSKKTLIEAEAASPEAYVKENGRFPCLLYTSLDIKSTMMYRHDDYIDGITLVNDGKVHLRPLISKTFAILLISGTFPLLLSFPISSSLSECC